MPEDGWVAEKLQCLDCAYRCVSVHPVVMDVELLECGRCHRMAMAPHDWNPRIRVD